MSSDANATVESVLVVSALVCWADCLAFLNLQKIMTAMPIARSMRKMQGSTIAIVFCSSSMHCPEYLSQAPMHLDGHNMLQATP